MLNLPKERIKEDKEIKVIMIRQLNPSLWCWGDTRYHPYKKKLFSIPCYHRRYYQAKYRGGGGGGVKGKVKIRMMRNKTSYRRLTSIYEDTKGKL